MSYDLPFTPKFQQFQHTQFFQENVLARQFILELQKWGFFSTLIIQSYWCNCKWNVTRIIYTYLHEFPNGDVGKLFKDLLGWQKINISFSIVAHPTDLREGEREGKFPLCQMCAGGCTPENSHFQGVQEFFFVSQSNA